MIGNNWQHLERSAPGSIQQPAADCTRQIGRIAVRCGKTLDIDTGDKGVERQAGRSRRRLQRAPEQGLERDRTGMACNGHAALDRPGVKRRAGFRRPGCGRRPLAQYICCPPLIDRVDPVTKPASSLHRKATPRAISSAWPRRPTGILATIFSSTGAGTAATISVSM